MGNVGIYSNPFFIIIHVLVHASSMQKLRVSSWMLLFLISMDSTNEVCLQTTVYMHAHCILIRLSMSAYKRISSTGISAIIKKRSLEVQYRKYEEAGVQIVSSLHVHGHETIECIGGGGGTGVSKTDKV